ncbi:unnamed protein product [Schistocephalus solidus]|uniref:Reverse transcriptase domain-containing protein n=1 Tax=Schistocephalus solidus TaxID=70667 RepID=A0A183T3X0_SCHSO|nr:unnamed protein product [Schistocephalus solidus]
MEPMPPVAMPVEKRLGCRGATGQIGGRDVRAALFTDSTACLLAEKGARKCALKKCWVSRLLQPAAEDDWFEENDADITNLLAENGLHKADMDLRTDATKTAFFRCRHLVRRRLREMQDAWMARKAEEIQEYAERNEMKNFFKAIKAIYGPCIKGTSPLLSSDEFSAMLMDAYRDEQPVIRIAYRTDGRLLNSRRMQATTHVSTCTIHDLLFAEDCALNTVREEDMQRSMDLFATGCANFGLTISTAKTVVMH